jgi:isocitrate dehydrogenase
MLVHIGQNDVAERVHNAWLRTLEDGIHTYDVYTEGRSKEKVGTKEFSQAVVARLGQKPEKLKAVTYTAAGPRRELPPVTNRPAVPTQLVGIDVYVQYSGNDPSQLAESARKADGDGLKLTMISNRGVKVWPGGMSETFCTDSFRCRFISEGTVNPMHVIDLQKRIAGSGIEIVKTESLRNFDGHPGYSLAQGQ